MDNPKLFLYLTVVGQSSNLAVFHLCLLVLIILQWSVSWMHTDGCPWRIRAQIDGLLAEDRSRRALDFNRDQLLLCTRSIFILCIIIPVGFSFYVCLTIDFCEGFLFCFHSHCLGTQLQASANKMLPTPEEENFFRRTAKDSAEPFHTSTSGSVSLT